MMKYFIILLTVLNFSCKSNKTTTTFTAANEEAILYYSKSSCNGKCPVYDLWIYADGSVSYSGISNVDVQGKIEKKLSEKELKTLKTTLNKDPKEDLTFKRKLDRSITTLSFNNKEYKYYTSNTSDYIKELDTQLKNIVRKIMQSTEGDI